MHDIACRVYGTDGLAPTMHTCGGGNLEPKILEPLALDEQNGYIRQDGIVGTLTTDGSSPKHNSRVIEPTIIYEEPLKRKGWHHKACEALNVNGLTTCLHCQSNNLLQKIKEEPSYRIRKLTEKECGRLMGVKDEDCEKIAKNQSTSSQYHLYGDSIAVPCLMAIFGELFSVDYQENINSLTEELRK